MRTSTRFIAGLAMVALILLAACNRDRDAFAASQSAAPAPESAATSSGGHVSERPVVTTTLPAGTPLSVRTTTALSTETQTTGQAFTAYLNQALRYEGREIAPKGAEVVGKIVSADKGGRVKDRASLAVQLTKLSSPDGPYEISTGTLTFEANATKGKDAAKVGIGSGVGAAIGAIAGGGKGAAIGAAAGGGAGAGVVLATRGDPAVIASETVLNFELISPVTVTEPK